MALKNTINKVDEQISKTEQKVNDLEGSFAMVMLHEYKKSNEGILIVNRRLILIIIILIIALIGLFGYVVYLLNDIGTIDESVTQQNENGYNNYIGNDGDITYGNTND